MTFIGCALSRRRAATSCRRSGDYTQELRPSNQASREGVYPLGANHLFQRRAQSRANRLVGKGSYGCSTPFGRVAVQIFVCEQPAHDFLNFLWSIDQQGVVGAENLS